MVALALPVLIRAIYLHVSSPCIALTLNVKVGVKPLLNKEAFCWELSEMNCVTSTVGDTGRILILYVGAQSVEFMKV